MDFVIEKAAIASVLDHMRGIVERRNSIPILGNILLSASGGSLKVTATDLDIELVETARCDVQKPGDITAPAHLLYDIVRKLPAGSHIRVRSIEKVQLEVTCARSKFTVPCLPKEDFPQMGALKVDAKFAIGAGELRGLVGKAKMSMSTEETRFYLNGFFMHPEDGSLRIVSTDGHRLTRLTVSLPQGAEGVRGVIVPRKTANEIVRLLDGFDGDVEVGVSDTKIALKFGDMVMRSKLIDGTFPDYNRVIPTGNKNIFEADVVTLSAAIDRASTVLSGSAALKLTLDESGTKVSAINGDSTGSVVEEFDATYSGPHIEIGFNHKYLTAVLAQISGARVRVLLGDSGSPTLFDDPTDGGAIFVLMPMRFG